MELGLTGRRALITGGSKGIGFACAKVLAREGCDVVLISRTAADLTLAQNEIRKTANVGVKIEAMDLSKDEAHQGIAQRHGEVDILVNNAGAIPGGTLADIDQARWRAAWDLKMFGYIGLTRLFHARMAARGKGVIVNIIGAAGERMNAAYVAGSTANAGLMAFTRALGGTSPSQGVRVVGINPGPVATGRFETLYRAQAKSLLGDEERWHELTAKLPFGRAATPEEIANMVAFLASDLSAYTTGTIITIDGGLANRG
jgi:3-oxoacyl-[acyl-carrier protein] reductase